MIAVLATSGWDETDLKEYSSCSYQKLRYEQRKSSVLLHYWRVSIYRTLSNVKVGLLKRRPAEQTPTLESSSPPQKRARGGGVG